MRVGLAPAISLAVASWRNNWKEMEGSEMRGAKGGGGRGGSMSASDDESYRLFSSTSERL